MSCILYYSNYCEFSKALLKNLLKIGIPSDIHFIPIDKRINEQGKMYVILENGQKIVFPEHVTRVPALLLLTQNYKVLYGNDIQEYLKPKQETAIRVATQNNMEPEAFSLGCGLGGICSDNYSSLDIPIEEFESKNGSAGLSQMHNYAGINYCDTISNIEDDTQFKSSGKISQDITTEQLMKQREQELNNINFKKPNQIMSDPRQQTIDSRQQTSFPQGGYQQQQGGYQQQQGGYQQQRRY
jgi:hypothetical protein